MATAVPEGVHFSGCLQGTESYCPTWAQLSHLPDALAGTSALYKKGQATKSRVVIFGLKLDIPMACQTPLTLRVLVSLSVEWVSPKDLLIRQIWLNFLLIPQLFNVTLRKLLVSVTQFPTSKIEEIRELQSGVCLCLYLAAFPRSFCVCALAGVGHAGMA